ncbi:hypothetical protein Q3G72_032970 [Acer saccharum]|nr:hypothetical protein Q3G72_032970 [Acer saccharum]
MIFSVHGSRRRSSATKSLLSTPHSSAPLPSTPERLIQSIQRKQMMENHIWRFTYPGEPKLMKIVKEASCSRVALDSQDNFGPP